MWEHFLLFFISLFGTHPACHSEAKPRNPAESEALSVQTIFKTDTVSLPHGEKCGIASKRAMTNEGYISDDISCPRAITTLR